MNGTVYLLHFDRALGNPTNHRALAQHYLGWCYDLADRLATHRAGRGAHITRAAAERGIAWECVATWPGDYRLEKRLKALKAGPRLCPHCGQTHRRGPLCLSYNQLELPLDEFPVVPAGRCDWFELSRRASWLRRTSFELGDIGGDIPF